MDDQTKPVAEMTDDEIRREFQTIDLDPSVPDERGDAICQAMIDREIDF